MVDIFDEHYILAYDIKENEPFRQSSFQNTIENLSNSPQESQQASQNSSLTGLNEQVPHDNQNMPSRYENDEERIGQSNGEFTSISKNKNSHKKRKIMIDPNGATTNYQTNGTNSSAMKKKNSRR